MTQSPGEAASPGRGARFLTYFLLYVHIIDAARQKYSGNNSLRPCTCKQLLSLVEQAHGDAEFSLDGADLSSVSLVAQIRSIRYQTTNTVIALSDGTGTIEGRMWKDAEDDAAQEEDLNTADGIV